MILLILFLSCVCVTIGTGLLAGVADFKGMTIPNRYSLLVAGAFICAFAVLTLGGRDGVFSSAVSHGLSALIVFGATLWMFLSRVIGAGDSKLGTAFALWVGLKGLPSYLFFMAVVGGILGLATILLRKKPLWPGAPPTSWIARAQRGENAVPYGIAIVAGAIFAFVYRGYLSRETLVFILQGASS